MRVLWCWSKLLHVSRFWRLAWFFSTRSLWSGFLQKLRRPEDIYLPNASNSFSNGFAEYLDQTKIEIASSVRRHANWFQETFWRVWGHTHRYGEQGRGSGRRHMKRVTILRWVPLPRQFWSILALCQTASTFFPDSALCEMRELRRTSRGWARPS